MFENKGIMLLTKSEWKDVKKILMDQKYIAQNVLRESLFE